MLSPHEHQAEETYFVLEGKAGFWTNTDDEVILGKHKSAYFPPGEKHAYRNAGTNDLLMQWALADIGATMGNNFGGDIDE